METQDGAKIMDEFSLHIFHLFWQLCRNEEKSVDEIDKNCFDKHGPYPLEVGKNEALRDHHTRSIMCCVSTLPRLHIKRSAT